MRRLLFAIPLIALLLLAAAIGYLNRDAVTFNFLLGMVEMRLATLLALTLLVGAGCGACAMLWPLARLRWRLSRLQRQHKVTVSQGSNGP